MMLLDTHVLVRFARGDPRLGRKTYTQIATACARKSAFMSALSFWELSMLNQSGRVQLGPNLHAFREDVRHQGIREVPLDSSIAMAAGDLPHVHKDPADRMLVATAMVHGMTLVTSDAVLLDWQIRGYQAQDATA